LNESVKNDAGKVLQAMNTAAQGGKTVQAITDKLAQENYKDPNPVASLDALIKDRNTAVADKEKADKQVTDVAAALKSAGVTEANVVKGVADLADQKKQEAKKVSDTLEALKSAGVNADDPAKGVAALDDLKKGAEKKIEDTLAVLKTAGVTADDPVKGV